MFPRKIRHSLVLIISAMVIGLSGAQGASAVPIGPLYDGGGGGEPQRALNDFFSQPKIEKVVDAAINSLTLVSNARQGAGMLAFYTGGGFLSFQVK
jgi:hypothetical protein